ncbi:MAG: hypothetical protein DWQ36_05310 [Acidobacteria bacterium]|nr:MAG: hypothetical protein DWQ30_12800 [Acidobacteriota bacterium]REK10060.1 MAG: hypothetical protein DWQ36_05310 [Acidobacteriota bacterium]
MRCFAQTHGDLCDELLLAIACIMIRQELGYKSLDFDLEAQIEQIRRGFGARRFQETLSREEPRLPLLGDHHEEVLFEPRQNAEGFRAGGRTPQGRKPDSQSLFS